MMKRSEENLFYVPIYNVPMMSDDEWNALVYKNWLERKGRPVKESRKEDIIE